MPHPYAMAKAAHTDARIHWTIAEKRDIAAKALELKAADPALRDFRAVDQAQRAVLPRSRQRPFIKKDDAVHGWLLPLWREMQAVGAAAPRAVTEDAPQTAEAAVEPANEPQPDATPSSTEPLPAEALTAAAIEHAERVQPAKRGPSKGSKLTRWTDEERRKIAAKSRYLMKGFADMSAIEAVRKAVAYELPADRQRSLTGFAEVKPWIEPMWAQLEIDEKIEAAQAAEVREAREREETMQRQADEVAAAKHRLEIEEAVQERLNQTSYEGIIKMFASKLANEFMHEIGAAIKAEISGQIGKSLAASGLHNGTRPDAPVEITRPARQPRILVCGLINQQIEDVKRTFGASVAFSFAKSQGEGGGASVREQAHNKDVVICMTDFCGHNVENEVKRSGAVPVRLTGSVSSLKRWLTSYLSSPRVQ